MLSDDLAGTGQFYEKVLGLKAVWPDQNYITFKIGYTKLIFRKSDNAKPVYHFAIDVPNNRFEQALTFVKAKVPIIPIEGKEIADFVNWDAKSFYFYDNNGNILECITRYPNKIITAEDFSPKSYISISEIGLVTNDVPHLADALIKQFGVPIFSRQPRGEHFTVSGNDEGLFIIASKGRDWYPTHVKSGSFRTRVLFSDGGAIYHVVR